jgi:hypothetical protein
VDFRLDRGRPSRRSKTGSGPNRVAPRATFGEIAPISAIPTTPIEPTCGPLSRPSLARMAGYDLKDGNDNLINAVRHGPPKGDIV